MFEHFSYIGYTLLFCLPPFLLLWLRKEFFDILKKHIRQILLSTFVLMAYGGLIWPVALKYGAWSYDSEKISNIQLFDYVYIDDLIWWFFIGLLFSSFVTLSRHFEARGTDIFLREIKGLLVSLTHAFRGLSTIRFERNATIHISIAVFVLLEGYFFKISRLEWMFVLMAIGMVLGFELLNSSVERLASKLQTEMDPDIRTIKDTAAAGVLIASIAAALVGVLIFLSRLFAAISQNSF